MSFSNHFTQFDDMLNRIRKEHGFISSEGGKKDSSIMMKTLISDQEIGVLTKLDSNDLKMSDINNIILNDDAVSR